MGEGIWQWKVVLFGVSSDPTTFKRLMDKVLKGLQWQTLLLYLDNVILCSTYFDRHV